RREAAHGPAPAGRGRRGRVMSIHPPTDVLPRPVKGPPSPAGLDVRRLRDDFPVLRQKVHGKPLVYLDNAATTQKPLAVLDAVRRFYANDNANIHRAVHQLSQRSTRAFEEVRLAAQRFLNADSDREIIFTRGATEG